MNRKIPLIALISTLLISCLSGAENAFEQTVHRIEEYLKNKPVILLSKKTLDENKEIYAYFSVKVINFKYTYNIHRTFSSDLPYRAILTISCQALDNSLDGDVISDVSEFQIESSILKDKKDGFSTIVKALANTNFDNKQKLTLNIVYDFKNGHWIYNSINGIGPSDTFIYDLSTLSQNENFRQAIRFVKIS